MTITDITSVIIAIGFLVMTVYLVISVISMVRDDRRRRHSRHAGATVVGISTPDPDGKTLYVLAADKPAKTSLRDRVDIRWARR